MRALAKVAVILFSLSLVMVVTHYTLEQNLQAGVYPTDADSIAIPLVETAGSLIVILVPLGLAFLLTNLKFFRKRIVLFIGAFLYIAASALASLLALSWFTPHHYNICAAYLLVAAVAATFAVFDIRRPRSNPTPQRTPISGRS